MQTQIAESNGSSSHQNAQPTYEEIFDGRKIGIVIAVVSHPLPYTKVLKTEIADIGDYLQFGSIIGQANGKNTWLNYYVHGDGTVDVKRLVGKKIFGHPVVMKKTYPDGREFFHIDLHAVLSIQRPTHSVVAKSKAIADGWWLRYYGRKPSVSTKDHSFELPLNAGTLTFMCGEQKKY